MGYVLVLHRWTLRQARYSAYPRAGHEVVFLATPASALTTGAPADQLVRVTSLDDPAEVDAAITALLESRGTPERIVGLNEADLMTAARWRERLALPGDGPRTVARFRDKLTMLGLVRSGGVVPVPEFLPAGDTAGAVAAAGRLGYPVVCKPRDGTASLGVRLIDGPGDWDGVEVTVPSIVQRRCDWPIGHVDGWWDGRETVVARSSLYVNDCANFLTGRGLGSYELGPGPRATAMTGAAHDVLTLMSPGRPTVFHLELFVGEHGEVRFLEIAARAGGAEIPFLWREVHGTDLIRVAWCFQMGLPVTPEAPETYRAPESDQAVGVDQEVGAGREPVRAGWALSHQATRDVPHVYWSSQAGPPDAAGVYEGARTRYRLRAAEPEQVEKAIQEILLPEEA
ncbi:hypothetical protein KIH74_30525 [Kineosporia sp. J2-2]|uniref:ATP-grasp domain-containing protein n=1 Tax=Kineosporia corallincola TaxID=2835133 RepID=A0ABS5TQJ3_9ACTN|nr:hypothetical protein [Kineosporia corallincola]MBT0773320.1 hypothetical protein [Kineosporia corallincola]